MSQQQQQKQPFAANEDIFNQLFAYFGESTDWIKFSIIPGVLLLSTLGGLQTWLFVELLFSLALGVVLTVYPQPLLEAQMKGPIDSYHLFLCSLLGCYVIYSALFTFFLRKSKDESIMISHFWSRIISCNLMFITMGFAYLDGLRWTRNLLCISGGPVLVTLVVNAFFLSQSTNIRAQTHYNLPANTVAKIEFFMLVTAGLVLFAFPDHAMIDLREPNESHRLLCRLCGVILFSLSFESFTMPSFIFEKDKQSFLTGRLIGSILELVVIGLGYYYFKVIKTERSLYTVMGVNMSYNLLVLYGYLSCASRLRQFRKQVDDNYREASANNSLNLSNVSSAESDKKSS